MFKTRFHPAQLVPELTVILALAISHLYLPFSLNAYFIALPTCFIFYWSLFRPDLLPLISVFLLGLLHDFLLDTPTGFMGFTYLILSMIVRHKKEYLEVHDFEVIWLNFVFMTLMIGGGQYLVLNTAYNYQLPLTTLLYQALAMILFPTVYVICTKAQRYIHRVMR